MALAGLDAREPVTPRREPAVSLVATVRDEAESIGDLLDSIHRQTRAPREVVIVDGGSRDDTWARLESWRDRLPLRLLPAPGANIARGRNLAIRAASHDLIATTDGGVRLDPCWLERLLARLEPGVDVVSGFFRPDARSTFELAMGATVLPVEQDVRASSFLPSSRSLLFRRSAWEAVGGYPEWLDYGEDLVFDLALKRAGVRFALALDALALFRPRGTWRAYFRQYYLYARGDGKADLWRHRHAIRYATYAAAALLVGRWPRRPATWLLLGAGLAAYTRRPYVRLAAQWQGLAGWQKVYAALLVPWIRAVGDAAKMVGYPAGVCWRHHARRWSAHGTA